jgi:hypothetical protein
VFRITSHLRKTKSNLLPGTGLDPLPQWQIWSHHYQPIYFQNESYLWETCPSLLLDARALDHAIWFPRVVFLLVAYHIYPNHDATPETQAFGKIFDIWPMPLSHWLLGIAWIQLSASAPLRRASSSCHTSWGSEFLLLMGVPLHRMTTSGFSQRDPMQNLIWKMIEHLHVFENLWSCHPLVECNLPTSFLGLCNSRGVGKDGRERNRASSCCCGNHHDNESCGSNVDAAILAPKMVICLRRRHVKNSSAKFASEIMDPCELECYSACSLPSKVWCSLHLAFFCPMQLQIKANNK